MSEPRPDGYTERRAPAPLSHVVDCVWTRSARRATPVRVVPDGCVDVWWNGGALLVAGPDTVPHPTMSVGHYVAVRFAPGAAPAALGFAADALRDARVSLDQVWPGGRTGRLADRLHNATDVAEAQRVLLGELTRGIGANVDPLAARVLDLAQQRDNIATMADRLGLSERQLRRRCLAAFGYGPKTLHRVLRFRRAVELARSGTPFAEVAHRAGYADQAHLSREVKALSGVSLGTLTPPRLVTNQADPTDGARRL